MSTIVILDRQIPGNDVHVPPHKFDILKRPFIYNGSVMWNNLPWEIKTAENLNQFKYKYKTTILNP